MNHILNEADQIFFKVKTESGESTFGKDSVFFNEVNDSEYNSRALLVCGKIGW